MNTEYNPFSTPTCALLVLELLNKWGIVVVAVVVVAVVVVGSDVVITLSIETIVILMVVVTCFD